MNLYLMRHGLAVERGTPGYENDDQRPLTPQGGKKIARIAEALHQWDLSLDLILSSPLPRALETAEIAAGTLRAQKKLHLTEHLAPGGSAKKLILHLLEWQPAENVLLVGHEPDLGRLLSLLVTGRFNLQVALKKGGVCKLSVETLKNGRCASLEWLLTPKLAVATGHRGSGS